MRFPSRPAMVILFILALALAGPVSGATGSIQITVNPGGGTVCLDTDCRENQGTTDEAASTLFTGVEADCYHMLNVYGTPGYEPYMGQVFLDSSGETLAREVTLKKEPASSPATGSLRVFITPDGGKACLDRMCELSSGDRSGSWSVQFTDITANTYHTLAISNEGYETFSTEIRLLPGQINSMSVSLKPLPAGSTPIPTPAPPMEPENTPAPRAPPTQAAVLPWAALIAAGVGAVLFLAAKHRP